MLSCCRFVGGTISWLLLSTHSYRIPALYEPSIVLLTSHASQLAHRSMTCCLPLHCESCHKHETHVYQMS